MKHVLFLLCHLQFTNWLLERKGSSARVICLWPGQRDKFSNVLSIEYNADRWSYILKNIYTCCIVV